jgi:AAA+ superfamily predicted ATPase
MLARAVAAQTKSTFLKLAGPQLVQMFIGDGAKLVRDAFALAKEKAPAIIFIDELDAIGLIFSLDSAFKVWVKEPSASTPRRRVTGKCSAPCWNC